MWIHAKAKLAQRLIKTAWNQTLVDQNNHKPWPWADTWPVAHLSIEKLNMSYYVLSGAQGSSLAFGPGYLNESTPPESSKTKLISAHRDTHFSKLEHIEIGMRVSLRSRDNKEHFYRVSSEKIYDTTKESWTIDLDEDQLQLITCYPFNTLSSRTNLRLVVIAVREKSERPMPLSGKSHF